MRNIEEVVLKDLNATVSECILINGENMHKNFIVTINDVAQEPDTSANHMNKEYYLAEGYLVFPKEEAYVIIQKNSLAKYVKDFKEITEDEYYHLLEVLPPKNLKRSSYGTIFLLCEYMYMNITTVVVEHKGRYFEACDADTISYKTHIEVIEAKFFGGAK